MTAIKKYLGVAAAIALAAVAYLAGGATINDAAKIATNVESAKIYCSKLLEGEAAVDAAKTEYFPPSE